ncbi:MAG: two-component regulator propeller domain-containing protein, partial [Bacteroidales bacterium]
KDRFNNIWYCPESKGLVVVGNTQKSVITSDDFDRFSISSNILSDIFQDKQGNLWITSIQGDLNYLKMGNPFFSLYKNPYSSYQLSRDGVTALCVDKENRLWVGYQEGGLDIIDLHRKQPRKHIEGGEATSLGKGAINCIYQSNNGTIWIGTYEDGLKRYRPHNDSFESYRHDGAQENTISGNDIRAITEDDANHLWLAVQGGGVDRFDPATGAFTHINLNVEIPNRLLTRWAFSLAYVNEDSLWIGTLAGTILYSVRTQTAHHYASTLPAGFQSSNSYVHSVVADSKGNIWFGTKKGLNHFNRAKQSIETYTVQNGLPNDVIYSLLEDNQAKLWISTGKGLCRFDPEREDFTVFTMQDGLTNDQFYIASACKSADGTLFFGGKDGITWFNPLEIRENSYLPPVYITKFLLFNKDVEVAAPHNRRQFSLPTQISFCDEIALNYKQNVLSFEFSALNYESLEKNLYSYKLEGFDKEFSAPGPKREVTYTNLHPGEYRLRVKASNNDGKWNEQGATLKIIVHPPFWLTYWAYLIYLILLLGILYVARKLFLRDMKIKQAMEMERMEVQKLQELDGLKMQFFSNISHEFRTPLTLIVGPVERMLQTENREPTRNQLNIVHRNVQRLLRLINQLMDVRKLEESKLGLVPAKADFVLFLRDVSALFTNEATQRNITYSTHISCTSLICWFDSDVMDKILYNLLSNAFKYTPDNGFIAVWLKADEHSIEISIKDSGAGISQENLTKIFDRFFRVDNTNKSFGTGIGLSFVKELVELHKGKIEVESTLNRGSEFVVTIPLWLNDAPNFEMQLSDHLLAASSRHVEEPLSGGEEERSRLLIIEDNPDMRLFIKEEFLDAFVVFEASNGVQGVKMAFETIPDVIICDVMMPEMDGYEACGILKNDERTSHIPILMLTAKSSEKHTLEGLESGADDYVTKPFSSKILKAKIANLVKSRMLLRKRFLRDPLAVVQDFAPGKKDEQFLKKAYDIIERHLDNSDFEIVDLAKELGMSRAQLYRKISAVSGKSVQEFIRIIRLKRAAELFATTQHNISEVAAQVGFNSLSHFSHAFSDYFGKTPSKFLQQLRKRK